MFAMAFRERKINKNCATRSSLEVGGGGGGRGGEGRERGEGVIASGAVPPVPSWLTSLRDINHEIMNINHDGVVTSSAKKPSASYLNLPR